VVNRKSELQNRKFKVPPQIAAVLFAVGIAGLFYLDRGGSARPSKALWLPVIWLSTDGSRPVSAWLGMGGGYEVPGQLPPTSLLDQVVAGSLILLGIVVVIHRRSVAAALLRASWPVRLYFSFALVSLSWSDFPGWGFKRWVRALGDLVMVLIVVTDAQPAAALRRLFSRVGFILLPASLLLIKYYPELGQGYDVSGLQMNTGVTTDKNMLGVLAFVLTLGTLWQVLSLLRDREQPNRRRRLLAHCTLLAFGIKLLFTAHSATAGACFVLGAGLMVAIALPVFRRSPQAVHALVLAILLAGGLTVLLGGKAAAVNAMGRDENLSGRTEIWKALIPMAPNPIGGAGFETFWVGPRVKTINALVGGVGGIHESHDGYIEVYLNLGCLGLGLIALILGQGYRRAVGAFRHDPALGALLVAYIVTAVTYNITEAGLRMLHLSWFFLLLSSVAASRVISLGETASESGRELADRPPGNSDVLDLNPSWMESCRPLFLRDTAGA
jgi:exopolysaccharide production protein ExoQ